MYAKSRCKITHFFRHNGTIISFFVIFALSYEKNNIIIRGNDCAQRKCRTA